MPDEGVNVKIGWPAGCMTALCYLASVALSGYILYKGQRIEWAVVVVLIGWFVANGVKANEARALLKDTLPSVKRILEGFGKSLPQKASDATDNQEESVDSEK